MAGRNDDPEWPSIDGRLDPLRTSRTASITTLGAHGVRTVRQIQQAFPWLAPGGALAGLVGEAVRQSLLFQYQAATALVTALNGNMGTAPIVQPPPPSLPPPAPEVIPVLHFTLQASIAMSEMVQSVTIRNATPRP